MYRRYKEQADFLLVYVREAHPSDGRQMEANVRAGVVYSSPTNDVARAKIASECVRSLGLTFPCALDDMQDTAQRTFRAWPARAAIVAPDGRLAFLSAPGPRGVNPVEIEDALKRILPAPEP